MANAMTFSQRTQKHVDDFMNKLFIEGERCEEVFRKLCKEGCEIEVLGSLLFAVCSLEVGRSQGLIRIPAFSSAQVKKVAKDLRSLAESVKGFNNSSLNPKHELLWTAPLATREGIPKMLGRFYDMLPGLMVGYSFHLERFYQLHRMALKRLTITHFNTLTLLRYVQERTGGPRYEDVSSLLTAGFLVDGGAEKDIPKIFSADALAKLNQRWANRYGR